MSANTQSTALKKKHNKTSDDSKFQGTLLGKPGDHGEIEIEGGGEIKSIDDWIRQRSGDLPRTSPTPEVNGNRDGAVSPSPSSGLSSVGDRLAGEGLDEMDLT